jgi:hypothetical protein
MILPLLKGIKTQTRRINGLKQINANRANRANWSYDGINTIGEHLFVKKHTPVLEVSTSGNVYHLRCPYGVVGDRLWVREAIRRNSTTSVYGDGATYLADLTPVMGKGPLGSYLGRAICNWQWQRNQLPSIFMPRWASRITIEIEDIRAERLWHITAGDAAAEGVTFQSSGFPVTDPGIWFRVLWDNIHDKEDERQETNPWVWVITFKKLEVFE